MNFESPAAHSGRSTRCGTQTDRALPGVVEEGSFTRAAARAFLVQSSLSASLLGLERELGTDLFIRGRRGAELTDAGHAFLEPARAALAEADRARDAVAQVKGLLRGSVRIATVPAAVPRSVDLIEAIRRFQQDHPQVHLQVVPTDCKSMVGMVGEGQVDFAITRDSSTPDPRSTSSRWSAPISSSSAPQITASQAPGTCK